MKRGFYFVNCEEAHKVFFFFKGFNKIKRKEKTALINKQNSKCNPQNTKYEKVMKIGLPENVSGGMKLPESNNILLLTRQKRNKGIYNNIPVMVMKTFFLMCSLS